MRTGWIATGIVGLTFILVGLGNGIGLRVGRAQGQPGVAERVGEKLDSVGRGLIRGAQEMTDGVRKRFEVVRTDVARMGVQPRVYSRIRWDRTLHDSRIEVHMLRDGVVLLRGVVPDAAARAHAVTLARDTVEVNGVIDELEMVVTTPAAITVPSLTRPR